MEKFNQNCSRFLNVGKQLLTCTFSAKTYLTLIIFSILAFHGQTIAQSSFNCPDAGRCVSQDLQVAGAFLTADKCSCKVGDEISATLNMSIFNKTGSTRTSFAFFATLVKTAPNGTTTSQDISRCTGPVSGNSTSTIKFDDPITFKCGDQLKLTNVYLAWTDASGNDTRTCTAILADACESIAPKCGTVQEIIINPLLSSTVKESTPACIGKTDGSITVVATGGTAPYSFTISGGTLTSSVTNTTGVFTGLGKGTYTFTVTDSKNCSTTFTYDLGDKVCCEFTVTCPTNTNLGTFNCSNLNTIPAKPATVAALKAAPYNIVIGTNPCGTILFNVEDNGTPNVCSKADQTITRKITIWDNTDGNTTLDAGEKSQACSFTFTVQADLTAPVFATFPADVSAECDNIPAFGTPTATDNCDATPTLTYVDSKIAGNCPQNYKLVRTWTATDDCGNAISKAQTITVSDTKVPVVYCPQDKYLECDASTDPQYTGFATAKDNCDPSPYIIYKDEYVNYDETYHDANCTGRKTILRKWIVTDHCGNSTYCIQKLKFVDKTAPVVYCPQDKYLECGASTDPKYTGFATAKDNCDPYPTLTYEDSYGDVNCTGRKTILRKWIAKDDCGNYGYCVQKLVFVDKTAPVITYCPPTQYLECDASIDPKYTGFATATDNCDPYPYITYKDTYEYHDDYQKTGYDYSNCTGRKTILRKWIATDHCGNYSYCIQKIKFVDKTPPVVYCPANKYISCNETPYFGTPTAKDNCDPYPKVYQYGQDVRTQGNCPQNYSITRYWYAIDHCGNKSATCSQTIYVVDNKAPVFTYCPPSKTIQCYEQPSFGIPTATDNCGKVTIDVVSTVQYGDVFTRTWKASDECGNYSYCKQSITVANCPHIFPTNTSCYDYTSGTAKPLDKVCYQRKHDDISNATPGVFFYYTTIIAPSSNFSVDLKQTSCTNFKYFKLLHNQLVAWTYNSCTKLSYTVSGSNGQYSINITNATVGQKIVLSAKYEVKSIIGSEVGYSSPNCTYTFASYIGGNYVAGSKGTLLVTANCYTTTTTAPITTTSPEISNQVKEGQPEQITSLRVEAYPNPYTDKVTFVIESPVSGKGSLDVYNMLGQKLQNVYQGYIHAGKGQTIEYNVPALHRSNMVYRLQVGNIQTTGKLIHPN